MLLFAGALFAAGFLMRAPNPFPSACFAMSVEIRTNLPGRAKLISSFNLTGVLPVAGTKDEIFRGERVDFLEGMGGEVFAPGTGLDEWLPLSQK